VYCYPMLKRRQFHKELATYQRVSTADGTVKSIVSEALGGEKLEKTAAGTMTGQKKGERQEVAYARAVNGFHWRVKRSERARDVKGRGREGVK